MAKNSLNIMGGLKGGLFELGQPGYSQREKEFNLSSDLAIVSQIEDPNQKAVAFNQLLQKYPQLIQLQNLTGRAFQSAQDPMKQARELATIRGHVGEMGDDELVGNIDTQIKSLLFPTSSVVPSMQTQTKALTQPTVTPSSKSVPLDKVKGALGAATKTAGKAVGKSGEWVITQPEDSILKKGLRLFGGPAGQVVGHFPTKPKGAGYVAGAQPTFKELGITSLDEQRALRQLEAAAPKELNIRQSVKPETLKRMLGLIATGRATPEELVKLIQEAD